MEWNPSHIAECEFGDAQRTVPSQLQGKCSDPGLKNFFTEQAVIEQVVAQMAR